MKQAKQAIVIGGSKGIGRAVAAALLAAGYKVKAASSRDVDTSDLRSVENFAKTCKATDVLVLNTGGPPQKNFFDIREEDWLKYHRQLFMGFCLLLQCLKINRGGYIFLISSHLIKEPNETLALSFAYRLAFWGVLKSLTRHYAANDISIINIAPGPIKTKRLRALTADMAKLEESLPFKRAGDPKEIGDFVRAIVKNRIKYLSGVTVNFDGGLSKYIF